MTEPLVDAIATVLAQHCGLPRCSSNRHREAAEAVAALIPTDLGPMTICASCGAPAEVILVADGSAWCRRCDAVALRDERAIREAAQ